MFKVEVPMRFFVAGGISLRRGIDITLASIPGRQRRRQHLQVTGSYARKQRVGRQPKLYRSNQHALGSISPHSGCSWQREISPPSGFTATKRPRDRATWHPAQNPATIARHENASVTALHSVESGDLDDNASTTAQCGGVAVGDLMQVSDDDG